MAPTDTEPIHCPVCEAFSYSGNCIDWLFRQVIKEAVRYRRCLLTGIEAVLCPTGEYRILNRYCFRVVKFCPVFVL